MGWPSTISFKENQTRTWPGTVQEGVASGHRRIGGRTNGGGGGSWFNQRRCYTAIVLVLFNHSAVLWCLLSSTNLICTCCLSFGSQWNAIRRDMTSVIRVVTNGTQRWTVARALALMYTWLGGYEVYVRVGHESGGDPKPARPGSKHRMSVGDIEPSWIQFMQMVTQWVGPADPAQAKYSRIRKIFLRFQRWLMTCQT